ncbi:DUF7555 family protein [Halocalculus aciditolerans]|uniref:DUF3899 domain-containing protein n=1 Tax=Halocalculus aciditolerans TaxID=1383812 RepID=A0A830EZY8_9EURY|nr:hypothetical protein [Halocalculus aciditolerans]GGL47279.1 hypothetical protein GCM10009039_01980 [Halocalculus aciditolerans]
MPARRTRRLLDLAYYAAAVTALLTAVFAVPSFALFDGWLTVKYGLFVAGFLLFGYSLFRLRPVAPYSDGEKLQVAAEDEDGFLQRTVNRLPPLRDDPLPPDGRYGDGVKLFAASLLVLVTSFLMEVAFGVAK